MSAMTADARAPSRTGAETRPARVAVVVVAGYLLFVVLRLLAHGGDVTAFVAAGDELTDPEQDTELTVAEDSLGYDGQFFYRLARSPLSDERTDHGVTLDRPAYRQARIAYPALVWATSGGGQATAVPWALVGVNVAAVGGLAWVVAELARRAGRSPWLALLVAAWPGFLVATARDLSEVVAAALLAGALLTIRDRRWIPAVVLLAGAGLARETTLVLALGIVGAWLLARLPARVRPAFLTVRPSDGSVPIWVGLVPLAVVGTWRAFLALRWAGVPDTGPEIPSFVGVPFVAFARQVGRFLTGGDAVDLIQLLQLLGVVAALVLLARAVWSPGTGPVHERLALAGALAVVAMLPSWDRAVVFLRWPGDAVLLGTVLALGLSTFHWRALARLVTGLTVTTALMWIVI